MARSKIVDEAEALEMLEGGATYPKMVDFYRERYHIETTPSMWSRFFHRATGKVRLQRVKLRRPNPRVFPWLEADEDEDGNPRETHGEEYRQALGVVERIEDGTRVDQAELVRLARVKAELEKDDLVIDYDQESNTFHAVPRREGIDEGWIRDPFLDDRGNPVPIEELRGYLRDEAIEDGYPFDPKELAAPPKSRKL